MVADKHVNIQEKLEAFLKRACPQIPRELQTDIAQEMKRSFDEWVFAETNDRSSVLEASKKRMIQILGIPEEFAMEVEFSKAQVEDKEAVITQTRKLATVLEMQVTANRSPGAQPLKLALQISNVEATDPKLFRVSCRISGTELRESELKHAKGTISWRRAGRPASVRFMPSV